VQLNPGLEDQGILDEPTEPHDPRAAEWGRSGHKQHEEVVVADKAFLSI